MELCPHAFLIRVTHRQLQTSAYFIRFLLRNVLYRLSFQRSFGTFNQVLEHLKIMRRSLHFSQQLKFQLHYSSWSNEPARLDLRFSEEAYSLSWLLYEF